MNDQGLRYPTFCPPPAPVQRGKNFISGDILAACLWRQCGVLVTERAELTVRTCGGRFQGILCVGESFLDKHIAVKVLKTIMGVRNQTDVCTDTSELRQFATSAPRATTTLSVGSASKQRCLFVDAIGLDRENKRAESLQDGVRLP